MCVVVMGWLLTHLMMCVCGGDGLVIDTPDDVCVCGGDGLVIDTPDDVCV